MATQTERKDETRARLLTAAAEVFAERGVEGASVDAIAARAERTSGALYAHFGSKEGLLIELLEWWRNEVSATITADLSEALDLDGRLLAMWHDFAHVGGSARQWVQLEHELWRWVTQGQGDRMRPLLADRYRAARTAMTSILEDWAGQGLIPPPGAETGPAMISMLIGLEMQHRLEPAAVPDEMAVAGMRTVLGL